MVLRLLAASAIALNLALPAFVFATDMALQTKFSDVEDVDMTSESIYALRSRGVVSGYADGTFRPNAAINRAEFTKIVIGSEYTSEELAGCVAISDFVKPGIFDDVTPDAWYFPHLCQGFRDGVITGYESGVFRPADTINYAEASKIIALTLNLPTPKPVAGTVWYKPYMDGLKLVNALPASYKSPDQLVTRGEMAFMIHMASTFEVGGSSSAPARVVGEGCQIGGCSGQLCVPEGEDVMSTCEYREEYQCYQTATCEKQDNGQCGWTQTAELNSCIQEAR